MPRGVELRILLFQQYKQLTPYPSILPPSSTVSEYYIHMLLYDTNFRAASVFKLNVKTNLISLAEVNIMLGYERMRNFQLESFPTETSINSFSNFHFCCCLCQCACLETFDVVLTVYYFAAQIFN